MDAQEAKKRVLERWEYAELRKIPADGGVDWFEVWDPRMGIMGSGPSEDAAWIDAASRLPVDPVASVELTTQPVADAQGETANSHERHPLEDRLKKAEENLVRHGLSPQPETAQGEKEYILGLVSEAEKEATQSIEPAHFWREFVASLSEPSQQENALQPQPAEAVKSLSDRDFVAAIASLSLDMDYSDSEALAAITKRCYDRIDFLAKYKPQPAESDGLEVAKEKWLRDNNYSCFTDASEETFDAGWQASRQSLLNKANEWERTLGIAGCVKDKSTPVGWVNRRAEAAEAKLSSLLAQKPEATVSFDRLAEVYNDSPLDGSVSHLCIEVMKYRQLFKDAEKGMR